MILSSDYVPWHCTLCKLVNLTGDICDQVEEVASTLGLSGVLDSRVHLLSGGEKKRVSIGMELVTNPPIMFCDEPTRSGFCFYIFHV